MQPSRGDDNSALTSLYLEQVDAVYRYFYHHVHHVHDAEDLTATTFSKAVSSFGQYSADRGTFAAWLFGIARRALADHLRQRHAPVLPTRDMSAAHQDPERVVADAERATLVRERLQQLPMDQRDAVIMRFFGALSVRETAAAMGKSEAAVKMLVHRALCTLRTWYETEERVEQRA
ncbi:MAG: sigma-70 family RNA polymerase sigma factor [Chloroflexota bacterium]|nr:sigma-70 family RNA polymerase sigma factor [Chloroflexota bacterium]